MIAKLVPAALGSVIANDVFSQLPFKAGVRCCCSGYHGQNHHCSLFSHYHSNSSFASNWVEISPVNINAAYAGRASVRTS